MKIRYPDDYQFSEEEAEQISRELERTMPDERVPDGFHERLMERLDREVFHRAVPVSNEVWRSISEADLTEESGILRRCKRWLETQFRQMVVTITLILLFTLAGLL